MSQQTISTSNGGTNGESVSYSFTVRIERPIQGCELAPNPFLQLKSVFSADSTSTRARMVDPNSFYYSYVWKRGPKRSACCNPNCLRGNSFDPSQWSKAALGGPELICNVCTTAGFPAQDASFCSRSCFLSAWKEHSKRHINMKASNKDYDGDDGNNDSTPASSIIDNFNNSEWTKIGDAKTYTPVAEDVGSRLRIEVTALSTADNSVMAGPVAVLTEPVLSQPGRPPKRSLQTIPGSGTGIAGAVRFRVVSYNILAELYATKQAYPYCDTWNLSWPFRRKIILDELDEMQGDVVCLQEVQADHYESDINPFMIQLGYDGIYKPKSRDYVGQYAKVDGCATFWKKNKFMMTENYCLEFNDMARQEASTMGFDESDARRFMNRLNRDNIAQIVVLESLSRTAPGRGGGRSLLCVVNTHLYSNHQRPDVKLWQTMNLAREIQSFVSTRDLALLICGDFNSEPTSAVYEYLKHGAVSSDHPELHVQDAKVRVLPDAHNILHDMHLASAMEAAFGSEPTYTNYTAKFKGTLDYIYYSPNRLRIMAATSIPDENDIRQVAGEGLPCACYPSDHILLCCDVAMIVSGSGSVLNDTALANAHVSAMQGSSKISKSNLRK